MDHPPRRHRFVLDFGGDDRVRTNATMVDDLVASDLIHDSACIAAFQAVDRKHFWTEDFGDITYADMPLRHGKLHLSAPHMYSKALESLLPMQPGMSFLNIGSGTGYFNSVVSELIGPMARNNGVEIWEETVEHARSCCASVGKDTIEFTTGNIFHLDVTRTTRYDRIYLGACASSRSKYIYRLLEVGGVLVGPFEVGRNQQLRRVVRVSETRFDIQVMTSVQFASLLEPLPPPAEGVAGRGYAAPDCLPGVPFTFALSDRPWSPARSWLFPSSYRRVASLVLLSRAASGSCPCLPAEIWVKHILPWCSRGWFQQALPPGGTSVEHLATEQSPLSAHKEHLDEDEAMRSDDGDCTAAGSTHAPSSGHQSNVASPLYGPSAPPGLSPSEVPGIEEMDPSGTALYEVFPDGRRHWIGALDDPDHSEEAYFPRHPIWMHADLRDSDEESQRRLIPARIMQFVEDVRRRRSLRSEAAAEESEEPGWEEVQGLGDHDDEDFEEIPSGHAGSESEDWDVDTALGDAIEYDDVIMAVASGHEDDGSPS